jgi:hypothetical protein
VQIDRDPGIVEHVLKITNRENSFLAGRFAGTPDTNNC